MSYNLFALFGRPSSHSPWDSSAPIREELFGLEQLEEHATSLATAQLIFNHARNASISCHH